ncbi:MAG: hypothetical protein HRU30_07085 [Rhodobacteraceae bacterium]|nr:hypothetical protein [Paracoccaceae bacterium]
MSDPMSHSEVEDVLSSIRKLVSDTKPKTEPDTDARLTDKLVLTPSLRVTDALDNRSDAEDDGDSHLDPLQRVTALLDEAEQTIREPKPAPLTLVPSEQVFEEDHQENAETSQDDAEEDDAATADIEVFASEDVESDEEPSETVQSEESQDLVPTGWLDGDADENDVLIAQNEEQDEAQDTDPKIDWKSVRHETLANFAAQRVDGAPQENEVHASEAEEPAESLGEKVAALETLIQNRSDQWEPDDAGTDEYAGTEAPPMAWKDVTPLGHVVDLDTSTSEPGEDIVPEDHTATEPLVDEDAPRAAQAPVTEAAEPAAEASPAFDEDLLDEDALRDLVSEIVREELQGALGEKITRNVRKLVRREIHRILAAQDYE